MIIHAQRIRENTYRVTVFTEQSGVPIGSFSDVYVYIDDKQLEKVDELYIEAYSLLYYRDRGELRIYTRT